VSMSQGTATSALRALQDLVDTARTQAEAERVRGYPGTAQRFDILAGGLDAARTSLVQEGESFLPVAWAYVDSGRLTLARELIRISRRSG
jgi:hypothetical protein